jgi:thioredoxin 1
VTTPGGTTIMFGRKRIKPLELKHLEELEDLMEGDEPILLDFYQVNCRSCQIMDGIVNEIAEEYAGGAKVVKVDVGRVAGAAQQFRIQSTPTFVVLGRSQKTSKKKRARQQGEPPKAQMTPRWRVSGLVQKDQMKRVLESNGARQAED